MTVDYIHYPQALGTITFIECRHVVLHCFLSKNNNYHVGAKVMYLDLICTIPHIALLSNLIHDTPQRYSSFVRRCCLLT